MVPRPGPILLQLLSVKIHPLQKESQGSLGEGTCNDTRFEFHEYFLILVPRVEMGRLMITVVHVDNNAVEAA